MTAELDLQKTRAFCEELCSRTQLERDFTRSPSLSCSASSATNKELSSFLAAAQGDGANETLTLTLPGGLKQSLTVEALTPKLRYRHPEHTRLHAGYSFPPYFLRNEQRSLLLAPPLTPNAMLHRARSTDFHAVERASSVKGVCLAFVPEGKGAPQWVAQLKHCFAQLSDVQLVLISESKEQRALAATLGQTVPHLLNIDLGEQSEAERIEALMFALSSVDVVLSLFSSEETLQNNVLELRTEAALAASAGIGVISLVERLQLEELENAHYSPAAELLPMPHLAIISPAEGKNLNSCPHLSSKLRSCVLELGEGVAANSLEQWLEDAGTTAIYRRIKALALA